MSERVKARFVVGVERESCHTLEFQSCQHSRHCMHSMTNTPPLLTPIYTTSPHFYTFQFTDLNRLISVSITKLTGYQNIIWILLLFLDIDTPLRKQIKDLSKSGYKHLSRNNDNIELITDEVGISFLISLLESCQSVCVRTVSLLDSALNLSIRVSWSKSRGRTWSSWWRPPCCWPRLGDRRSVW